MLINGKMPGPTIIGNWGDTFRITVRNMLQHNGTSIHWHGLRQLGSNSQDGVSSSVRYPPQPRSLGSRFEGPVPWFTGALSSKCGSFCMHARCGWTFRLMFCPFTGQRRYRMCAGSGRRQNLHVPCD